MESKRLMSTSFVLCRLLEVRIIWVKHAPLKSFSPFKLRGDIRIISA